MIAELLDRHGAVLELYASRWTQSPEDCVQEAFIELARQPQQPESVVAWLYSVVRNRALNAARSARRRSHYEQLAGQGTAAREDASPVDRLSLPEALSQLSAEEHEIVVLRIWSGLTWQEIAELVGTSSSSAQRKYVESLKQLRKFLEPTCQPNEK